ncbi:pyruvate kinase [Tropheryma whipplei]|nr:pyruvate kinase [Tropheryma whipplei]MCO8190218.1 pyruvate kinase [Tropheryma whipplei]
MRRAKIVVTLGPAVSDLDSVRDLISAGADVFRMNLSHGSLDFHREVFLNVRTAAAELDRHIAIFADLQGPKIRLGRFASGPYTLQEGDIFTITTEQVLGTKELSSTTLPTLPDNVSEGDLLLIDDGKVALRAIGNDGVRITTRVEVPGKVSNNKGINLPGVGVKVPALSEKDIDSLRWALSLPVDMIALSFVRCASDVDAVHKVMDEEGIRLPVIAKIEKPQAVSAIEEIALRFDAIMVARGDLGVELPLEDVPVAQKEIVKVARRFARPVIIATQMLESMISSSRPTRAEASDVANAVLDGADALMLSGETSVGEWPVEAVRVMSRVIEKTEEKAISQIVGFGTTPKTQGGALAWAAAKVAEFIDARYLCVFSESGDSIRRVSRLRHDIPIIGFSPVGSVVRQVSLSWGVRCFLIERLHQTDQMMRKAEHVLLTNNLAEIGEKIVIISGSPVGVPGSTNHMRIHELGSTS